MSETHRYWAYAAVPGALSSDQEKAAVDEGRRERALDLAVAAGLGFEATDLIAAAREFEAYLKGDVVEDVNGVPLGG